MSYNSVLQVDNGMSYNSETSLINYVLNILAILFILELHFLVPCSLQYQLVRVVM